MSTHAATPTLLAALAAAVTLVGPAQASNRAPDAAVTRLVGPATVAGRPGGDRVVVTFADTTPSGPGRYRLRLAWAGGVEVVGGVEADAESVTGFVTTLPPDVLRPGETCRITVEELDGDGAVIATSAATTWTSPPAGP